MNVSELCANAVRGTLVAAPGKKLLVSDLSNIEGRSAAWLAGEEWKLEAFRAFDAGVGPDMYKLAYARSFGLSPEEVSKDQRQKGKVMELSCQYQGAVGAFNKMGANYGVELPEDEVLGLVRAWRAAHPAIKSLWYDLEAAAIRAVGTPGSNFTVRKLVLDALDDESGQRWLRVRLPTGSYLCYFQPEIRQDVCKRCEGSGVVVFREKELTCPDCNGAGKDWRKKLTYMGIDQYTKKWKRLDTYGGKIFENANQKFAREVFMSGFKRAAAAGYLAAVRVHDELVVEVPDTPEYTHERLSELLATNPAGTLGLPLAAAGHAMYRYSKGD